MPLLLFFLLTIALSLEAAIPASLQSASAKTIERALTLNVQKQVPDAIRIQVENIFYPHERIHANAELQVHSIPPAVGRISFSYRWMEGGRYLEHGGQATVRVYAKVAIAKVALSTGDAFTKSSVTLDERELSPLVHSGYFSSVEALEELRASGWIRPGTVIGHLQVAKPKAVRAGQPVSVVRDANGVKIVAQMRALENGGMADWIRVQNPGSRKIFQAQVVGPSTVEVQ